MIPLAGQNCNVEPRRNRVYKTQNLQNKNKSTALSNGSLQNPQSSNSLTHSNTLSLCPLKLTHSFTHSLSSNHSPMLKQNRSLLSTLFVAQLCRSYSLFLLNTLSFLLLKFLCLCLSFSNFRFWNFMM